MTEPYSHSQVPHDYDYSDFAHARSRDTCFMPEVFFLAYAQVVHEISEFFHGISELLRISELLYAIPELLRAILELLHATPKLLHAIPKLIHAISELVQRFPNVQSTHRLSRIIINWIYRDYSPRWLRTSGSAEK